MSSALGNCIVCGHDAEVEYLLLAGSPAFCGEHHNSRDAGPFGADLSGPDDFDIPVDWDEEPDDVYEYLRGYAGKCFKSLRKRFIWTDKELTEHRLRYIDDEYLINIINFLKRQPKVYINSGLVRFLEDEQKYREGVKVGG